MAEIVNLRMARKARKRDAEDRAAQQNRILYGRPKSERDLAERVEAARLHHLDGHRRETGDGEDT